MQNITKRMAQVLWLRAYLSYLSQFKQIFNLRSLSIYLRLIYNRAFDDFYKFKFMMFLVEYNNLLLFLEFICVLIGFVCVLRHARLRLKIKKWKVHEID